MRYARCKVLVSALSVLTLLCLTLTTPGQSSGGQFQITSSVVAGGGGESNDGANNRFSHESTIAEHAAGTLLRNPPFSQTAGFRSGNIGSTPTAAPAEISGQVTTSNGAPLAGVIIVVSGARQARAISDQNGFYSLSELEIGAFYTVTPARANYTFIPASRAFSLLTNKTDAVFTALATAPTENPLDTPGFFVRQQYLDFLGREPDQSGWEYWTAQINQCNSDAGCIGQRRIDVSAAFFASPEFQQTGSFIYGLYTGTFGRTPGYGEFMPDRMQVVGGASLDASKAAFADAFVQRPEFIAQYPAAMTRDQFVDALLQTMSTRTGIDQSALRVKLLSDDDTGGRGLVVLDAVQANAFAQAEYNKAFVLIEYFGYLRRGSDSDGYNFWLNVLNGSETRNYRGMVCSFMTSTEYQSRFSAIVTHSNIECTR